MSKRKRKKKNNNNSKRLNARLHTRRTFTQTFTRHCGFEKLTERSIQRAQRGMWEIQLTALNFAAAWALLHTLQIVVLATDKTVNSPRNGRSSFSRSRKKKKKKKERKKPATHRNSLCQTTKSPNSLLKYSANVENVSHLLPLFISVLKINKKIKKT